MDRPSIFPPSFLDPLRYVGDGDRYLMETKQECQILARLQMLISEAQDCRPRHELSSPSAV